MPMLNQNGKYSPQYRMNDGMFRDPNSQLVPFGGGNRGNRQAINMRGNGRPGNRQSDFPFIRPLPIGGGPGRGNRNGFRPLPGYGYGMNPGMRPIGQQPYYGGGSRYEDTVFRNPVMGGPYQGNGRRAGGGRSF